MITLSIIILSYNTKDLTVRCIESIVKQYKQELTRKEIEIIVVDNASLDDSVSAIGKISSLQNLKILLNRENVGFGKGCNIGAKKASGKYFLFLNSDTEVLDNGFLKMTEFLDAHNDVGILGGKLLNADGSLQPSGGSFYNLFNLFLMLLGGERLGLTRKSAQKVEKVDWVSGACMMVRSEVFEKLSGFDEELFMYMEDMELCFRAKELGFKTYFYPNISLQHKQLGSGNRTFAIINIYKGILHFYRRHKSRFEYLIAKTLLFAKAAILIFVGILTANQNLSVRYKKAIKF